MDEKDPPEGRRTPLDMIRDIERGPERSFPSTRKIKLKLIQILYDLLLNDDSIINDGMYVRYTVGENEKLVKYLIKQVRESDVDCIQES